MSDVGRVLTLVLVPGSFATVGMFSAVSNLGAGGLSDVTLSDTSQGVLYGCFAVTGLVSGGISNSPSPLSLLFLPDIHPSTLRQCSVPA